jgi:hypothetical protein
MNAILLALSLLLPTIVHAADYSGTWVLDKAKSTGLPRFYERVKSHTLVNKQGDQLLEVMVEVDIGQPQADRIGFAYPLDGSVANTESKIRTQDGLVNVPTTLQATRDAGGGLHIVITRIITMGGQQITSHGTEDWQLSEDGKTLNVHRTDESPRGKTQSDMVFVKA